MASKYKKYIEKPLSFLLVLSIVLGIAYMPREKTPKAEAILGLGDITVTVNEVVRAIIDGVAMSIAQRMIDEMVNSTIDWAQSGFDGSPAFVESPGGFVGDIANQEAGRYINELAGANLCSPFRPQIVLSLGDYYRGRLGLNNTYECTFTDVTSNMQAFLDGDFSQGGWDSWFQLTQNPANNPYEVYLAAQTELDAKIASKVNTEIKKLDWAGGFKSSQECEEYNSYVPDDDYIGPETDDLNPPPIDSSLPGNPGMKLKDPLKGPNECIRQGKIKTPGTIIKDQLNNVLPSGLEKLISVEHIEGLVSALATGLLNRYVFSSQGLTSPSSGAVSQEFFDQDKDGIPDGYDYDYDGNLDSCLHGLKNVALEPSNDNCIGSTKARSSEFYIPICEALQSTIHELEKFQAFIGANRFEKGKVRTWQDKTIAASGATDNLINVLLRHDVSSAKDYEQMLFTTGKYSKHLDDIIDTLVKDEDLGDKGFLGTGPGRTRDSEVQDRMIRNTTNILNYLRVQQSKIIGSCAAPDTSAWGSTPPPEIDTGGSPANPGDETLGTRIASNSFCSSNKLMADINESVMWTQTISDGTRDLPSDGTYKYSYTWMWGTSITGAYNGENTIPTKVTESSTNTTTLTYPNVGDFWAVMKADITDTSGASVASFTKLCNITNPGTPTVSYPPVTVFDSTESN